MAAPHGAFVPFGCYWATPFARWQQEFSQLHSLRFAAKIARLELQRRGIVPDVFDHAVLGTTRPERGSFYGAPWMMGLLGAPKVGGPTVGQACATGVRALLAASQEVSSGLAQCVLAAACDRTSNGPHIYYPNPAGPGGTGEAEDFIMENMARDPLGGHSMTQTAENCARKYSVSTAEQHELVLRREEQYRAAIADQNAFQKRFMTLPFAVPDGEFRKTVASIDGDTGIRYSTPEGLAKLKPVLDGGTVTYGGQTHPADGSAAMIVANAARAAELSRDPAIEIELRGFGVARAPLAYMPEAPVPAAQQALLNAGIAISDIHAIKTHNPFAVNDIVLAKSLGFAAWDMNNFGCSLVYGHPNAPTGIRGCIELIEELVLRGGGSGLFAGCAAGDTAMAVVISVRGRSSS
ncbi:MAG: thiolase family protein [Steroidobacteraceae bacterium]